MLWEPQAKRVFQNDQQSKFLEGHKLENWIRVSYPCQLLFIPDMEKVVILDHKKKKIGDTWRFLR